MKAFGGIALFSIAIIACGASRAIAQVAPGEIESAAHTANVTGTVLAHDGKPIVSAEIKLSGSAVLESKTNARGAFTFANVPWGTYNIIVTSSQGTVTRKDISVVGDNSISITYDAPQTDLKTIGTVSAASAGAHVNVTSSSIASVSPGDFAFQGNTTWTQLLAQVPGVAVSGYGFGGGSSYSSAAGAPQAAMALSINGTLPYETSTTLDGMPLQGVSQSESIGAGGGVDLSNLPMNAFDTADIVRGPGANAPSIVDSVGGSFVLHANGPVNANHFEFTTSNDPYGGVVSNVKAALRIGRLSATFIYGINDSPGPLGTTSTLAVASNPVSINGQPVQGSTNSYLTPNGIQNCFCGYAESLLVKGIPISSAWSAQNGAAALSYSVAPSVTASIFYAAGTSSQGLSGSYYPVAFTPAAAYSGPIAESPVGQANYTLLASQGSILTSQQSSNLLEEKVTAFLGTGVLRLAALQNNSYTSIDQASSAASSQHVVYGSACVGAAGPSTACPSGGTETVFNGTPENVGFSQVAETSHTWTNNRDILGSYALQVGPSTSVGVSYLKSYYNNPYLITLTDAGTYLFSLNQSNEPSETTTETRLYVDDRPTQKLSLGLSYYIAKGTYHVPVPQLANKWTNSDFPYSAPRFGAVWEAGRNVAIRGSAGGGFALPILSNLIGYSLIDNENSYEESIANLNLKPEEAFGYDVGADIRFHRNTLLSLDLYRTNLYGQFYTSTTVSTYNNLPLYITQTGNLGTSRYEGLNASIDHRVPVGIYWHGTFGLTRGYVVSVPGGFYDDPSVPCTKCANQTVVPGINFNGAFTATVPYASASAQAGYQWTPGESFDMTSTYYGNNNIYNTPHAFIEVDAHAGFPLAKHVSLLATLRNVTNAYGQSLQTWSPSYAIPTIPGATPAYPGAAYGVPFGPRSVVLTANVNF